MMSKAAVKSQSARAALLGPGLSTVSPNKKDSAPGGQLDWFGDSLNNNPLIQLVLSVRQSKLHGSIERQSG